MITYLYKVGCTLFVKSVQLQLSTALLRTMKWVLFFSISIITISGTLGVPMSTDDTVQGIKSILALKVGM